jgi:ABC-type multidrug transport system ATPase subunit
MSLVWENLEFQTDQPVLEKFLSACVCGMWLNRKSKRILNSVSGRMQRGELIALMGPSGAGKTSLFNCLTNGKNFKGFGGKMFVTEFGESVRASFINQDEKEHLLDCLTVRQSLMYASLLKNPVSTSSTEHNQIVAQLVTDLDLQGTEDTTVEKCSGGQKKRLSIGLELSGKLKPHFLFLDEPTS